MCASFYSSREGRDSYQLSMMEDAHNMGKIWNFKCGRGPHNWAQGQPLILHTSCIVQDS
jgi:hypothetical protein